MKQHSVPQEIMAVEFNLFGAMTVRQFGYVAGAGGLGYFLYLIMPGVLKWPFAGICVLFGLALAFIPINDRPLDQYVTNFLISLRNPTRRVWRKTPKPPSFLVDSAEEIKEKTKATAAVIEKAGDMAGAQVFTSDRKAVPEEIEEVEKELNNLLKSVSPGASNLSATIEEPRVQSSKRFEPKKAQLQEKVEEIEKKEVPVESPSASLTGDPNKINGIVQDGEGNPIQNAVVMVKNKLGKPVQAIRVNSKGEFLPKSGLNMGEYTVTVDAPSFTFDPKEMKIDGGVVPLIKFVAK